MTNDEPWYGYLCIEEVTITVDGEEKHYAIGDTAPSYIVAHFPRATRERYFIRNYKRLGDVRIQE